MKTARTNRNDRIAWWLGVRASLHEHVASVSSAKLQKRRHKLR